MKIFKRIKYFYLKRIVILKYHKRLEVDFFNFEPSIQYQLDTMNETVMHIKDWIKIYAERQPIEDIKSSFEYFKRRYFECIAEIESYMKAVKLNNHDCRIIEYMLKHDLIKTNLRYRANIFVSFYKHVFNTEKMFNLFDFDYELKKLIQKNKLRKIEEDF